MVVKIYSACVLLLFILTTIGLKAEISASVDRNSVRINETFELTLHIDTPPNNRPSLEGLPVEFTIVRSTNFYQRSNINGTTKIQAGWRFVLRASLEGVFTIPGFDIDGKTTHPLQIKVLSAVSATDIGGQQDAIRLTTTVDYDEVFVQQQILYTVRLYRSVQAQYASLSEPMMEAALLERLGEDRQFETEIAGVRYIVLERKYAIFPQQTGIQTIDPVTFTAEVSDGSQRYSTFGRLRPRTQPISLSSKALEINVKPRPKGANHWWLPAIDVTLTEQWLPEPIEFRVGNPITWSYSIKAKGLSATQLPELLPQSVKGLKFYPDKAESANTYDDQGITGVRTQKIAVIPTQAGTLTLPEIRFTWWNVLENKASITSLPPRTIEVLPSLDEANRQAFPLEESLTENISTTVASTQTEPTTDDSNHNQGVESTDAERIWKSIAIISISLWLILALIIIVRSKQKSVLKIRSNDHSTDAGKSLNNIRKACHQNSASATKNALLNWCSHQSNLESIRSIAELARHFEKGALTNELSILERNLYSKNDDTWQGKKLSAALNELKNFTPSSGVAKSKNDLPALHLTE